MAVRASLTIFQQFTDGIRHVTPTAATDSPKPCNNPIERRFVQELKVRDAKAFQLPGSVTFTQPSASPMDADSRTQKVLCDPPGNIFCRVQSRVNDSTIAKVDGYRIVFAPDANDLSFKRAVLLEWAKDNRFRPVAAWKRDHNLPTNLNQSPCGVVLTQHVVQDPECASHFFAGRPASEAAHSIAHLDLRRLIDGGMQDYRSFAHAIEMDRTGLAHQLGQRFDVFPKPLHRYGRGREAIIYVKLIFHGVFSPGQEYRIK
jgi:hypothetical protein